jgi:nucleoside-diphosphate-sugar epimerase
MADMMTGKKEITKSKLTLVYVRSVAEAHLNGIKLPEAANQRFMTINGNYWMKDMAKALSDEFSS